MTWLESQSVGFLTTQFKFYLSHITGEGSLTGYINLGFAYHVSIDFDECATTAYHPHDYGLDECFNGA